MLGNSVLHVWSGSARWPRESLVGSLGHSIKLKQSECLGKHPKNFFESVPFHALSFTSKFKRLKFGNPFNWVTQFEFLCFPGKCRQLSSFTWIKLNATSSFNQIIRSSSIRRQAKLIKLCTGLWTGYSEFETFQFCHWTFQFEKSREMLVICYPETSSR